MNQQSNVCFMDGIIAADNLDDNQPEMRRNISHTNNQTIHSNSCI